MKKIIFLFLLIFAVSAAAQAQQSTSYVDTATYNSDMELVANNFDSLEQRIAQAAAKDRRQYLASWDWRLRWTRAMLRGLFGADSAMADSLAREWLKNHYTMEGDVQQLFAGMRQSLLKLKAEIEQTRKEVGQNSQDIRSLAEGFLAEHGKGVNDRSDKKRRARTAIEKILNRYLQQEEGIEQWKKSRIP